MNIAQGVHVTVSKKGECIYDKNYNVSSNEGADIKNLSASLKQVQSEVNAFLSDLVAEEQGQASTISATEIEIDEDEDSDESMGENVMIKSKKCKLAN